MESDYPILIPTTEGAQLLGLWCSLQLREGALYACNLRDFEQEQRNMAAECGFDGPFGTVDQRGVVRCEDRLYRRIGRQWSKRACYITTLREGPTERLPTRYSERYNLTAQGAQALSVRGVDVGGKLQPYIGPHLHTPRVERTIVPERMEVSIEPRSRDRDSKDSIEAAGLLPPYVIRVAALYPTPDGLGHTVDLAQSDIGQGRMRGSYDDSTAPIEVLHCYVCRGLRLQDKGHPRTRQCAVCKGPL